jgi:hypothetical protein
MAASLARPSLSMQVVGWAQRALPIAVDTRPVQNRGYTGPIKSRFDAVTNAHAARKLVNTLSHLSRFFELHLVHTLFLTIRAKSKVVCFLAFAAVLHKSHWLQPSTSCSFPCHRKLSLDPHAKIIHKKFVFLHSIAFRAPEATKYSTSSNVSWVVAVQCTDLLAHVAYSRQVS